MEPEAKTNKNRPAKKKAEKPSSIFDEGFNNEMIQRSKLITSAGCVHIQKEEDLEEEEEPSPSMKLSCNICQIGCDDLSLQRAHFKSDWHVFNVKQKVDGKLTVNEQAFEKTNNPQMNDEINFESDTDDEDDNHEEIQRTPKVNFVTRYRQKISVYRSLLDNGSKEMCINCILMEDLLEKLINDKCWLILMMSGGDFAAAVFHKEEIVIHKAIHRYTVRAKRGTVQSQRDGKQSGRSPRSAGAHIRRQNEGALVGEIQELLHRWKEHVDHAAKIFIQWPEKVKSILYGGKTPILNRSDPRIRRIPFVTGKPTFEELKRIHYELSMVKLQDMPGGRLTDEEIAAIKEADRLEAERLKEHEWYIALD